MDASAVGGHDPGFAEHLTSEDLRLLRSAAGGMRDRGIEALLGDACVFDAVFGRPAAGFVTVSPLLAFAVAVHRWQRPSCYRRCTGRKGAGQDAKLPGMSL